MSYISGGVALIFALTFTVLLCKQPKQPAALTPKDWLQYIFLARYQLLLGAVLISFGWVSASLAPNLLGNLLILSNWKEVAVVTWLAILAAWVFFFTLRMLIRSAAGRFDQLPPLQRPADRLSRFLTSSAFFVIAAIPLLSAIYLSSQSLQPIEIGRGLLVGGLFALACGITHRYFSKYFMSAKSWLNTILAYFPNRLLNGIFKGYLIEHGQGSAALFFLITLTVYILGFSYLAPIGQRSFFEPPAIAYLLLLLILVGWILPGLAFFFDRYRLPVAMILLLVSWVVWSISGSDYFYPVQLKTPTVQTTDLDDLTAVTALEFWEEKHKEDRLPMVIVTASGGGIKAAIWTTTVLQALQRMLGEEFAEHIVLISSVSGGSVGVLHYMDAYQTTGVPTSEGLELAVQSSITPSLSSAIWGMVYPDLWPQDFSIRVRNRGWAMEQAWKRTLLHPDATLQEWNDDIRNGVRPPVFFNSTIMENGALFVFTPLVEKSEKALSKQFALKQGNNKWHSYYFNTLYPTYTVSASTAARMSATFPYVSPIARPISGSVPITLNGFHLADGGYFDNYGIVSALEWLGSVKDAPSIQQRSVLLVQIESSLIDQESLSPAKEETSWLYSVTGPLLGGVKSIFTAQKWRNDQSLDQLSDKGSPRQSDELVNQLGQDYANITLTPVSFVYTDSASLSWQLAIPESNCIRCYMDTQSIREAAQSLCQSFYPLGSAENAECVNLPKLVDMDILTPEQCSITQNKCALRSETPPTPLAPSSP